MSSPTAALYRLAPLFAVIFNPTLLYLLSVGLSLYLVYQNHKSATEEREKYEGLNIQGAYLDRDIHQISFIVWSGMNQLKRKSQGVSTIETWTVNFSRNRFVTPTRIASQPTMPREWETYSSLKIQSVQSLSGCISPFPLTASLVKTHQVLLLLIITLPPTILLLESLNPRETNLPPTSTV
jgi:hypothetical protein